MSECRIDAAGFVGHQELRIQRGERDPVTVVQFSSSRPVPDPLGLCGQFGDFRWGANSVAVGAVERLGVSPDGSTVVFEITDDFSFFPITDVRPEDEGMFVVRADGGGLRRLGPASREASFRIFPNPSSPSGLSTIIAPVFAFSRDGRTIAFTDLGPGPSGEEAIQIVALDLESGRRTQVTHLPTASPPSPGLVGTCCPSFVDARMIEFQTYADPDGSNPGRSLVTFDVKIDGTGLEAVHTPVAVPGSRLVPSFRTTGAAGGLLNLAVPGTPVNSLGYPGETIVEVFVREGTNFLQLTNFRRFDTFAPFLGIGRRRAFIAASADPLGTNPSENCQLFSIGALGGHLRQLTHFAQGQHARAGCNINPPPGCYIGYIFEDPLTGTIVYDSSCDPLGTNPSGGQLFAMRPDGRRLRQLTDARGVVTAADGSFTVELPGPFAYSGR